MKTSITLDIHLAPGEHGHTCIRKGKRPKHAKPTRLPRITRLMALAIKYEHLLEQGLVDGHVAIAALAGVDRSHISCILRLRLLAPSIQEWLLSLPEQTQARDSITWEEINKITPMDCWDEQRIALNQIIPTN